MLPPRILTHYFSNFSASLYAPLPSFCNWLGLEEGDIAIELGGESITITKFKG
jgi:hypothetical protein